VGAALAFPSFAGREPAAPLACFLELFAASPDAGAMTITDLRLSRTENSHPDGKQHH
jgi:hypothetical protein